MSELDDLSLETWATLCLGTVVIGAVLACLMKAPASTIPQRTSEAFEPTDPNWVASRDLTDFYIGDRRLLSILGHVFDVTESEMYSPGMTYHALLGRDASRAFALMSTKEEDMQSSLTDLTEKQLDVVRDWVNYFRFRKCYPLVGKVPRLYMEVPVSDKYKPEEQDEEDNEAKGGEGESVEEAS
eukprot:TRINITY_DN13818_c0_g1_i1.p1 TRINITY_DN13818_c0_g1~~TRINITY_DN13818_c0_g1_i1.p1  ORF type:complete len:184 (+),score=40.61 TRINITY_DN13818_c0_g1_i1:105-656(+)